MHKTLADDDDENEGFFACPQCDRFFTKAVPHGSMRHSDDEMEESVPRSTGRNNNRGGRSLGLDMMGFEPKVQKSKWVSLSDHDPNFSLVPSSKTTMLKAIL